MAVGREMREGGECVNGRESVSWKKREKNMGMSRETFNRACKGKQFDVEKKKGFSEDIRAFYSEPLYNVLPNTT